MPQLLLELFSEEIPARMQADAARDLERMARERLAAAGFAPDAIRSFAGPRRLTLVVDDLPAAQADRSEERKGPRVGAPDAAIEGFLRSAGVARDRLVEREGVYFATIDRRGRPTAEVIAEMVPEIVRQFPWPKSMKWGGGSLRWVRPLQRILSVFAGEVVRFEINGIASADVTEGHRFMGSKQPFAARSFDDYAAGLEANFVVLDPAVRRARILDGANAVARAKGLELIEDEGLLDEVVGLAEWPIPLLGDMDAAFLDLPPEVIRTSMRTNQKYFVVRDPATGGLAPHFIVVANVAATDGGSMIAIGNARVLSARLNDARFFWDEDRKIRLEDRLERLKGVTFHAKLGTVYERVERIEALARELAPLVGADPDVATQAARLSKADLATGMVGEFPELQGVMGGYYAHAEGLGEEIANAISDHYKPQGPRDDVPSAPVSAVVALADKLDTLVGFFGIGEKPTGSRDPYALRRATLGLIRLILNNGLRMDLEETLVQASIAMSTDSALASLSVQLGVLIEAEYFGAITREEYRRSRQRVLRQSSGAKASIQRLEQIYDVVADLLSFASDRLKVALRDQGRRHDLVDSVFALRDNDFVRIVARIDALNDFLESEDGANLLAGYKRAANILRAEEKKGALPSGPAERLADAPPEETALINALASVAPRVDADLAAENFTAAMRALAALRSPVDAFFEHVLVNDPDPATRANRLRLLIQVRALMGRVADFSLVSG